MSSSERQTEKLVRFVMGLDFEAIPSDAAETAKAAMLDCLGVALAGSLEPVSRLILRLARELGGETQAGVISSGLYTSFLNAALANGTICHALDYDDRCRGLRGHPSCVLFSTILTLGKYYDITGREAICAYVSGFEAWSRVVRALSHAYSDDLGWHPTAPVGTLAAAIAAARIMKLSAEQAKTALGIAGSMASGLRENFGTMTKPFHAGNASRNGILAAMLAKAGFTASDEILESRAGFIHAFSGGKDYSLEAITVGLGSPLSIISSDTALQVKRYPCCGHTALLIDAVLQIVKELDVLPGMILSIDCAVPFVVPGPLIYCRPKTGTEGKFSMQYCLAAALLDRKITLDTFTNERVLRTEAQELFPKITMRRHPGNEGKPSNYLEGWTVNMNLKNGNKYVKTLYEKSQLNGITEEVVAKYVDCAGLVLKEADVKRTIEFMQNMEGRRLAELIDIVVKPPC